MIYSLWGEEGDFECLELLEGNSVQLFERCFESRRLLPEWSPIAVKRGHPTSETKRPIRSDFPWYFSHPIGMRGTAVEVLRPILDRHAELLPLSDASGVELYWAHVLTVVDALDEAQSEIDRLDDGRPLWIQRAEFHEDVIRGLDMFRLPWRGSLVYVTDRFRDTVMEANLKGLRFQFEWPSQMH